MSRSTEGRPRLRPCREDDAETWFVTLAYAAEAVDAPPAEARRVPADRAVRRPDVLDGPPEAEPSVERLAYRLNEVAAALGVSRRAIERERAAGRFPAPDLYIGKMPLWARQNLVHWVAQGGVRP